MHAEPPGRSTFSALLSLCGLDLRALGLQRGRASLNRLLQLGDAALVVGRAETRHAGHDRTGKHQATGGDASHAILIPRLARVGFARDQGRPSVPNRLSARPPRLDSRMEPLSPRHRETAPGNSRHHSTIRPPPVPQKQLRMVPICVYDGSIGATTPAAAPATGIRPLPPPPRSQTHVVDREASITVLNRILQLDLAHEARSGKPDAPAVPVSSWHPEMPIGDRNAQAG